MAKRNTSKQRKKALRKKNIARKIRNGLRIVTMCFVIGILIFSTVVLVGFFRGDSFLGNRIVAQENIMANGDKNFKTEAKLFDEQVDLSSFNFSPEKMKALKGKKIVIDPGHGGTDSGAIGAKTGVYESKLNMQVASRLAAVLEALDLNVTLTRKNTGTWENPSDKGLTWAQRGEAIANANADLLLSVHHNYNETSSQIHGVQILYREKESKKIAIALQDKYNQELGTQLDYLEARYKVLSYGKQAGIIIECGFLSNREEEKKLQTTEYQDFLVKVAVETLAEYFTELP